MTSATLWPRNIRQHNQRVWIKPLHAEGQVIAYTKRGRKVHYYTVIVTGPNAYTARVAPKDLLTGDKWCDECGRCLPYSCFNGGGQVHNPYDGCIEHEMCFLCAKSAPGY